MDSNELIIKKVFPDLFSDFIEEGSGGEKQFKQNKDAKLYNEL